MKQIKFWLPTIIYMGIIFLLSSRPRVHVSDIYTVQFLIFKSLHIAEYALLYLLLYRSLKNTRQSFSWQNRLDAWLGAVFYAVSDEIHQVFVPTREGRMRDITIDTVGVTLAAYYLWKLLPQAPKKLLVWAKKLQLI